MISIPYLEAMIVWETNRSGEPNAGEIHVINDREAGLRKYDRLGCSLGSCTSTWSNARGHDRMREVFHVFMAVLEDGIDPKRAHSEFMKIDVYRDMCGRYSFFGIKAREDAE